MIALSNTVLSWSWWALQGLFWARVRGCFNKAHGGFVWISVGSREGNEVVFDL